MHLGIAFDGEAPELPGAPPGYFADLHLDRVLAAILYDPPDSDPRPADADLAPYFHLRLTDPVAVRYRQDVVRDLTERAGSGGLRAALADFTAGLAEVRELDAGAALPVRAEADGWKLAAAQRYLDVVAALHAALRAHDLRSAALCGLRAHVAALLDGPLHTALAVDAADVAEGLRTVAYAVSLRGGEVRVSADPGGVDHGAAIAATFARFRLPGEPPRVTADPIRPGIHGVPAAVLGAVAALHPEPFHRLRGFCDRHGEFIDPVLATVDRDIRFYLRYLDFAARVERAGQPMCLPVVTDGPPELVAIGTVDLALAVRLQSRGEEVVGNDLELTGPERIAVLSGPNEGGKTALARAYGQLFHLAALGLPVPGRRVRMGLCDAILTHFERGELAASLHGRLEDDILAVHEILTAATDRSVIVLNETFSATTLRDARTLGRRILDRIIGVGARCVYVTFVDDLADAGPEVVGMVSCVAEGDPSIRTHRVVRRRGTPGEYADLVMRRYGLDRETLTRRIRR